MTKVLITIDTELSIALHRRGVAARGNFESSMLGRTPQGDFGIGWQMDMMDRHGIKGVFFIDPLPALVLGAEAIADTVQLVVERGHEVQTHIHTEWVELMAQSPVGGATGRDIADFSVTDQRILLSLATDLLTRFGALRPTAFRAGNYGADDNSLIALASLSYAWESSFNPGYAGNPCRIGLPVSQIAPVRRLGLTEVPVSGLEDTPGHFRPAQVCALSSGEMKAALDHAAASGHPAFTIVCHSFEMLSRNRARPNRLVMARFEAMCRAIAENPALTACGFHDLPADFADCPAPALMRLPANRGRTRWRQAEQAFGTWAYERRLRPG